MSNEEHPPSVEVARAKIKSALQAEDNHKLTQNWKLLPPDTKHQIEYAVASALTALGEERKEQARREHRAKAKKWYWNECKDIKEQHRRIAASSVVLTPSKITFRDFEACLCPHGWNWDYCESLGQGLTSLRKGTPDASSDYRLRVLRKAQIDPATARLGEDVCAPGARDRGPRSLRPAPPNGRPPKIVENTLLQMIVPCLKQAGWTYVKSFDFLARLLINGFGRKSQTPSTLSLALARQWRYLNRSKSPT